MKRSLFLLVVMLPFFCFAQKKGGDKLEPANREEAADLYQYAINLEQQGSLVHAIYAFIRVFYFDSTSDIAIYSAAKLPILLKKYEEQVSEKLKGSWQWKWSGSNWGTGNEPEMCKCERSIVFDSAKIYFLTGNTVDSSFEYSIRADNYGRWPLLYYIDIPGLKEKWNFNFRDRLSAIPLKDSLSIRRDRYGFRCICGCPEDMYERVFFK
ncbi:MAG: hypothetical protein HOP10_08215 [Chitinophagaceae bacterium]|nr:hypothetical protein [Chitinophagaceae bacterium]